MWLAAGDLSHTGFTHLFEVKFKLGWLLEPLVVCVSNNHEDTSCFYRCQIRLHYDHNL